MTSASNVVEGDFIGTNASGANLGNGVGLMDSSGGNTIGGPTSGAGNIIGFNTTAGMSLVSGSDVVEGNLIGTNVNGANLGNPIGMLIESGGNTVGGVTAGAANIIGFNISSGLYLMSGSNVVEGDFIGTNAAGANLGNAVGVLDHSGGNTVGGITAGAANLIGFNTSAGIQIGGTATSGDILIGNVIGTNASGQVALGNGIGVLINGGSSTMIGGTTAGAGNVVSGNLTAGIEIDGTAVSGTQIVGNRIGTDPTGTSAVVQTGQSDPQVALQNAGIVIIGSQGNTIGGTSSEARNLISGNYVGVMLATISGQGNPNQVLGNWIGTDASGQKALGNIVGIYINGASGNQVGGTGQGSGNTISGNSSVAVEIYGSASTANLIEGNIIGLAGDGRGVLRKGNGLFVQPEGIFLQDASGNVIGGTAAGAGNVISGNESAGIFILGRTGVSRGNIVESNLIGLGPGGSPGPGNDGYGVLLANAQHNQVQRAGPAANRFGRNGIASVRHVTGPLSADQALASARRTRRLTSTSTRKPVHPAGPARYSESANHGRSRGSSQ